MGWWGNLRSRVKGMPLSRAVKIKYGLSFVYFFCAWNLLAVGLYTVVKKYYPESEEEKEYPSRYYARLIGTSDARVYKISGLNVTKTYQIESMDHPDRKRTYVDREKERIEQERLKREEKEREELSLLVEETSTF